jgi:hypothetical protein
MIIDMSYMDAVNHSGGPGCAGMLPPDTIVELSWLYFMFPGALPLVPLTRFPGFLWLIAMGLALRRSIEKTLPHSASRAENAT